MAPAFSGGLTVLNFLLTIHQTIATVVLIAGGLTLITGIVLLVISRSGGGTTAVKTQGTGQPGAQRAFRVLLGVTAAIGALQGLVGLLLLTQGAQPADKLHFVYGIIVLAAIPVAYVYSDQKEVRRDIIIMTIAAAAIIGAAIRAFMTGAGH